MTITVENKFDSYDSNYHHTLSYQLLQLFYLTFLNKQGLWVQCTYSYIVAIVSGFKSDSSQLHSISVCSVATYNPMISAIF